MSKETRYVMYFISFMMSVKLHKYRIVTIYYQSELSGGHCRSAATMPLHVVCRGEECRSETSVNNNKMWENVTAESSKTKRPATSSPTSFNVSKYEMNSQVPWW